MAEDLGWRARVLDYRNSGDTAGDKKSVVGYTSIAFYSGLNETEQAYLTSLARLTLTNVLNGGEKPKVDANSLPPKLREKSGCFVTLEKHGQLRGCIGHILPQELLYQCVIDNAVSAALYDGRFNPVSASELTEIHIEVSVLSNPKRLAHSGGSDLLNKLTPNIDGLVLRQGRRQSTYLPQVWEQIPDATDFLTSLCKKGGMSSNCWRDEKTVVEVYRAQVFTEK
jgi:AmmeMemoRadiSam system protein A